MWRNWCLGDLYSDVLAHACDHALLEIVDTFGLTQHVKSSTCPASGRTLDPVFSTNNHLIQACHVIPSISNHDTVLFEVDVAVKSAPKPPRRVYQFLKGDYEGLRDLHLSSCCDCNLASSPKDRTVDENWSIISDFIKETINKFIPSKMTKSKCRLPWISPTIKKLMNKHDCAHKKAKRSGKAQHLNVYRLQTYTQQHN